MLDHPPTANVMLAATAHLASLAGGARINVLAARIPPASTIMPTEEVLTRDTELRLRAREAERVAALKAAFDTWSASAVGSEGAATWFESEATPSDLVTEWGKRADIIVVERPSRADRGTTWQALPAALFGTDRPVLVVPPRSTAPFGQRVAIAWRDDPHATRAVLSALRYLREPSSVHLLAGVRPGAPNPVIPAVLIEHGIAADLQIIPIEAAPFGRVLLAGAHAVGADLLVMGAYAHSPLRERILGGVTRHVLGETDLPVLMRH